MLDFVVGNAFTIAFGVVAFIGIAALIEWLIKRRLSSRKDPTESRPQVESISLPVVTPPQSYDNMVRAWYRRIPEWDEEIAVARQEAFRKAVEDNEPMLLTIRNYYEMPDQPEAKIAKVEPLPQDDPRRSHSVGEVVVDDQREYPHDQCGYKFLPRPQREAWVKRCKDRKAALVNGALRGGKSHPDTQSKIDYMTNYMASIAKKSDAAYGEELEKIKLDAEQKAREIFLKDPLRLEAHQKEADERKVTIDVVNEEFVGQVVASAAEKAHETYTDGSLGDPNWIIRNAIAGGS